MGVVEVAKIINLEYKFVCVWCGMCVYGGVCVCGMCVYGVVCVCVIYINIYETFHCFYLYFCNNIYNYIYYYKNTNENSDIYHIY